MIKNKEGETTLSVEEKFARLRLIRTESIGALRFWEFINAYGSAQKSLSVIKKSPQLNIKLCDEDVVGEEIESMEKFGAQFVFLEDELYPPMLRNIPDPPPVLAFLGNESRVSEFYNRNLIAVVGARNASLHSMKFCEQIVADLGRNGITIVSGLARGIDSSAHKSSLKTGTLAVIACGINIPYPSENKKLYEEIAELGGIFTEMPFDTVPQAQLFPRRNRIIAGMSYGTIVVEAAEQSGSLITAHMALEYNREVFAVPGFPMDPRSIGSNLLIKEGATLVQNAQDVLEQIESGKYIQKNLCESEKVLSLVPENLEKTQQDILNFLSVVPVTIDELISRVKVSPQEVLAALLKLELENKVVRLHGQRVCLTAELN